MDFSFEKVTISFMYNCTLFSDFHVIYFYSYTMSKWKYTFFSLLKTHSAYMLFYKRMEPEEENGKEYKFDVSSELLEV